MRYFDLEKIERGTEPLSPTEQEVRERLTYELKEQLFAKMDLEAALAALTAKQRACFLRYAEGHTFREIARELALSLPTVQQHLASAKRRLQRFFHEAG